MKDSQEEGEEEEEEEPQEADRHSLRIVRDTGVFATRRPLLSLRTLVADTIILLHRTRARANSVGGITLTIVAARAGVRVAAAGARAAGVGATRSVGRGAAAVALLDFLLIFLMGR